MRCPDCNKFVSLETQEPEVSDLEVEYTPSHDVDNKPIHEFTITGTVRVVRNCGECAQELKESTLEIEQTVELGEDTAARLGDDFDWAKFAAEHDLNSATVEEENVDTIEEGGGRYAKSYYGASATFNVSVDGEVVASVEWSDKVAASQMDEMV